MAIDDKTFEKVKDLSDNSFLKKEFGFKEIINPSIKKESVDGMLNFLEFIEKHYPEITLYRRQEIMAKFFYGIDLTEDEKTEILWLKENKGIDIPLNYKEIIFREMVIVAGRRGGKTRLISLLAIFELYKLIFLKDPQSHYKLTPGSRIDIINASASEEQAMILYDYIQELVEMCDFFKPYIDKISGKKVRLFTPSDLKRGVTKGTLYIHSLTSLSRTTTGYTAIIVIIDELAYFINNQKVYSGDAMYKAITPSVKTFGKDGKIIVISSPLSKAGKLYDLYDQSKTIKSILCFQYASWEMNDSLTREDFKDEFEKDPVDADMAYGANFGSELMAFFDPEKIDAMVEKGRNIMLTGTPGVRMVATLDPATRGDRYAIAWGHKEIVVIDGQRLEIRRIDGLRYWEPGSERQPDGSYKKIEIDIEEVDNYILDLIKNRGFYFTLVAYDQWNSAGSRQKLEKQGVNAIETTFTNQYKNQIFPTAKSLINQELVKIYDTDDDGSRKRATDEMKVLQRKISGRTISYSAPTVGNVTNDEGPDVICNLIYLLDADPASQIMRKMTKLGTPRLLNINR